MSSMQPRFFSTPSEFRTWLEKHHATAKELLVGFHKKGSGTPSITWPEAVDEALSFGWVDSIRRSIDDVSYTNRFTPRTARSRWSARNIERAKELIAQGRMHPAGRKAFEARTEDRSAVYSYEQRWQAKLGREFERQFRSNTKAWAFFMSQPPGYRTTATYWVVSAKRDETRRRRLATLIDDSAQGRTVRPLTSPAKRR
jgi:uncharacterized protein YdeI (YjbR/CyaY-like superfamily)